MDAVTNFDDRQCHKWAQLLNNRKQKLIEAQAAIKQQDFDSAKNLFNQIFTGVNGKKADPGMAGSLLYHMAMVSKMESETHVLLKALKVELPDVSTKLNKIYCDFESDAKELTKKVVSLPLDLREVATSPRPSSEEKIKLFTRSKERKQKSGSPSNQQKPQSQRIVGETIRRLGKASYKDAAYPRVRNNQRFTGYC